MLTSCERRQKDRRSIRLRGYDYTEIGWYFVTFCTQNRNPIFGQITAGKMKLSPYGHIARRVWRRGKNIWKGVHLDAFIIMPDHIHAIIFIKTSVGATSHVAHQTSHVTSVVGATSHVAHQTSHVAKNEMTSVKQAGRGVAPTTAQPRGPACKSIGAFIGSYKSVVSKIFNKAENNTDQIWQRNYYERIIRNENQLHNIREYIRMNPVRATPRVAHREETPRVAHREETPRVAHRKTFNIS